MTFNVIITYIPIIICIRLPGIVISHHPLIVEFHVKFQTTHFTEQHVSFVHYQIQLGSQIVNLLALLIDDSQALFQRNANVVCSVAAVRLAAAQSIGGGLWQSVAIFAHVPVHAVSHNSTPEVLADASS